MKFTAGEAYALWLALKFHQSDTEDCLSGAAIEAKALLNPWVLKLGEQRVDGLSEHPELDLEAEVSRDLLVFLKKVFDGVSPRTRGLGGWSLDIVSYVKPLKTTLDVALAAAANGKEKKG